MLLKYSISALCHARLEGCRAKQHAAAIDVPSVP